MTALSLPPTRIKEVLAAGTRAALDIDGVIAIGLDAWRANYRWPISDRDFDDVSATVWDEFVTIGGSLEGLEQDLWFSDIRIVGFLLQHRHMKTALQRFEAAGEQPVFGKIVEPYLFPDWRGLGSPKQLGLSSRATILGRLRGLAKTWVLNRAAPLNMRVRSLLGQADTWALGSRTPLRGAYLKERRTACRFISLSDICSTPRQAEIAPVLREAVQRYFECVTRVSKKKLAINIESSAAARAWLNRLSWLNGLAAGTSELPCVPKTLLVTELGSPGHRIAGRAMHRRGSTVIGFHHGNGVGAQPSAAADLVDLIAVDRFVVPSATCRKWRKQEYEAGKAAQFHQTDFDVVAMPIYRDWLRSAAKAPLPSRAHKVMIVGYPPNWIRYAHFAGHWALTQFHTEITLIECLRKAGFEVLYKAHPEWEQPLKKVFAGLKCQFVGGRLEDCWQIADAFVFPRISSTSFGFALCTNRPIVLFDFKGQRWIPEAHRLLARRCHMVAAEVDQNLRARFDEEALVAALRTEVRSPDQAFVLQAMCD